MKTPTIYDYPAYYDLLFSWNRDAEASFYDGVFALNGVGDSEPILEVAAGTGQIARRLARLGRDVTGLDASRDMLDFLRERSQFAGECVRCLRADMTDFSDTVVYGAVLNPMNSFGLLQSDDAVVSHFRAVASVLRSGGIYVLDIGFCEDLRQPSMTTDESWEMSRDGVTVVASDNGIRVNDHGTELELQWADEAHLRDYTVDSFAELLGQVDAFRLAAWHPELDHRGEDGVSLFSVEQASVNIAPGRGMAVLRRV